MSRKKKMESQQTQPSNLIQLYQKTKRFAKPVPRNLHQEDLLDALQNSSKNIVCVTGPAGSGKTWLSTLWAIEQFQKNHFQKIIISRPNIATDNDDIGFLPGDIMQKMMPWMLPILDVFKEFYSPIEVEHFIKNEIIEIVPVAYIRGRTFKNSVILIDEAQNLTKNAMLSVLTRIGENSKMIVTGDIRQSDRGMDNGLGDLMSKLSTNNSKYISHIVFDKNDIERHPAVKEILNIYGEE